MGARGEKGGEIVRREAVAGDNRRTADGEEGRREGWGWGVGMIGTDRSPGVAIFLSRLSIFSEGASREGGVHQRRGGVEGVRAVWGGHSTAKFRFACNRLSSRRLIMILGSRFVSLVTRRRFVMIQSKIPVRAVWLRCCERLGRSFGSSETVCCQMTRFGQVSPRHESKSRFS